ncbi:MAG: MBL fold metallo-hydrolase [Pseudomonadota bacterium]
MTLRPYLLLVLIAASSHAIGHESGSAEYLGNEGVLVAHGDTRVLFDAFYAQSFGQYALLKEETVAALLAGTPPYDGIDAVFVSHVHGDHFTPGPTIAYLRAQPEVPLYGSSQIRAAIADVVGPEDPLLERVHVMDVGVGDAARRVSVGDLDIAAVAIPHAGGARRANIINLAFRVTLDRTLTVLHLGDADPAPRLYEPHADHWREVTLDAAFPPYWFYGSPQGWEVVREHLRATATIGIHVPTSAIGRGDAVRSELGGDAFTDPGERRVLTHGEG